MLFNSFAFLAFAVAFFALWPMARGRASMRHLFLIAASAVFYGWWDWRYLGLIALSGAIDYGVALGMHARPEHKRRFLAASLLGNLGLLAAFKYASFLASSLDSFVGSVGFWSNFEGSVPPFMDVLPVGISFYTFQSMSYTIDVYRGRLEPTRNPLHFFAYLSLFPQLVAGPIVRASELLPQLVAPKAPTEKQLWDGAARIARGFFKKTVIADNLAPFVDAAFGAADPAVSAPFWWLTSACFALQIYGDFSGYSDIAIGLGKWMGLDFPENFRRPYVAASMKEFWARWHISLSTWFRDYVYLPLGGSRGSAGRVQGNLWATFVLSGLWHGAAWTFVAWGAAHAALLSLERLSRWPERLAQLPGGRVLARAAIFAAVLFTWVLFRAEDLGQARQILGIMLSGAGWTEDWTLGGALGPVALVVLAASALKGAVHDGWLRAGRSAADVPTWLQVLALLTMAWASIYLRGPGAQFIYFQF